MKAFASWCALLCLAVSVMGCQDGFAPESGGVAVGGATAPVEVYFSPKGGCTQAVVRELNRAQETVLVQAYSFTSVPIAKALLEAHKRGVKVQVILDKSQRTENYSADDPEARCLPGGVPRATPYHYQIVQTPALVLILLSLIHI